jgi:hypothetical protein
MDLTEIGYGPQEDEIWISDQFLSRTHVFIKTGV